MNEHVPLEGAPLPEPLINPIETDHQEKYHLLVGHTRTDGSFKSGEQLRSEYVHRTDELIRQMTEGIDVTDRKTGETVTEKPDYVVFLDKSARPVSWLVREMWDTLAPAPGSEEVPEMPKIRYLNIDRQQWVNTVDPNGTGYMDVDRIDPSIIRSLRSIFVAPQYKEEGLTEEIDTAPSELDDSTTLIVDEVMSTGRTADIAKKLVEKAFPTARVGSTYWMSGITQRDLVTGNADLPVWYKDKSNTGRGVDNRDELTSQRSASRTQRLGSWFLSTRFSGIDPETGERHNMDPDSVQLREELHNLAHDPEVLIVPSLQRDDFIDRATTLNGVTFDEFKKAKDELNKS